MAHHLAAPWPITLWCSAAAVASLDSARSVAVDHWLLSDLGSPGSACKEEC